MPDFSPGLYAGTWFEIARSWPAASVIEHRSACVNYDFTWNEEGKEFTVATNFRPFTRRRAWLFLLPTIADWNV